MARLTKSRGSALQSVLSAERPCPPGHCPSYRLNLQMLRRRGRPRGMQSPLPLPRWPQGNPPGPWHTTARLTPSARPARRQPPLFAYARCCRNVRGERSARCCLPRPALNQQAMAHMRTHIRQPALAATPTAAATARRPACMLTCARRPGRPR